MKPLKPATRAHLERLVSRARRYGYGTIAVDTRAARTLGLPAPAPGTHFTLARTATVEQLLAATAREEARDG